MPSSSDCWGIEVGAYAVKVMHLKRSGDQINVAAFDVIPHKQSLNAPDADPDETIRVALDQFLARHQVKGASVMISVPGHAAFARFAKLPPVEPKQIPDIVKYEAVQADPLPPRAGRLGLPDLRRPRLTRRRSRHLRHHQRTTHPLARQLQVRRHQRPRRHALAHRRLQRHQLRPKPRATPRWHHPHGHRNPVHRPHHHRERPRLAANHPHRRQPLHRSTRQILQALTRQSREAQEGSHHQQIRPTDLPGHATRLRRPRPGRPAIARILPVPQPRHRTVETRRPRLHLPTPRPADLPQATAPDGSQTTRPSSRARDRRQAILQPLPTRPSRSPPPTASPSKASSSSPSPATSYPPTCATSSPGAPASPGSSAQPRPSCSASAQATSPPTASPDRSTPPTPRKTTSTASSTKPTA